MKTCESGGFDLSKYPILGQIGNTPLVKLCLFDDQFPDVEFFAKMEMFNPGGSIKDRPALRMITKAIQNGELTLDTAILDSTSGNAGIAYAMIGAVLGYRVELVMPDNASEERKKRIVMHGANIVFTDAIQGYDEAMREAHRRYVVLPDKYFMIDQYENDDNWLAHYHTTAIEILEQTQGELTHFVAGVGTGGTLSGVSKILKKKNKKIKIIAVEPEDSPVISGGSAGPHKIQGIGAGFIPKILNKKSIDEIIQIANETAFSTAKMAAKTEGLPIGISSGAALAAGIEVAQRKEMKNKKIIVVIPSFAERYLSTSLFS